MTLRVFRWSLMIMVLGLGACVGYAVSPAPMPKDPVPPNAAQVCIVRTGSDGALQTFPVRDNGVLVGATVGGSCFCYLAGPGSHEIESRSDGFDTLSFSAEAGKQQFIVQATRAAVGIVRSHLEEISLDEGRKELEDCQYSVLTQVPEGTYKTKPGTIVAPK